MPRHASALAQGVRREEPRSREHADNLERPGTRGARRMPHERDSPAIRVTAMRLRLYGSVWGVAVRSPRSRFASGFGKVVTREGAACNMRVSSLVNDGFGSRAPDFGQLSCSGACAADPSRSVVPTIVGRCVESEGRTVAEVRERDRGVARPLFRRLLRDP